MQWTLASFPQPLWHVPQPEPGARCSPACCMAQLHPLPGSAAAEGSGQLWRIWAGLGPGMHLNRVRVAEMECLHGGNTSEGVQNSTWGLRCQSLHSDPCRMAASSLTCYRTAPFWGKGFGAFAAATLLSPCLFNLHAEYIMRNARLEEAQAGIKHKPGEISITSDMQMTLPLWQKVKRN